MERFTKQLGGSIKTKITGEVLIMTYLLKVLYKSNVESDKQEKQILITLMERPEYKPLYIKLSNE